MSLCIQNATLHGETVDCLIDGGRYAAIGQRLAVPADAEVLDARGDYIVPPFYNAHAHSPMSLFRGLADDMALFTWLRDHVWPAEARLTPADIRRGAILAVREMVRGGTVFFNDMYWRGEEALRVAAQSGVRAAIGLFVIEERPGVVDPRCVESCERIRAAYAELSEEARGRILLAYAPHAIYSVSEETLVPLAAEARAGGAFLHIHAAETRREFDDCVKAHGMTPIAWLDRCGALTPKTILAHCVHLTEDDMALVAARGAVVSHQPCSNYKLCSGQFDYRRTVERHRCRLAIGTDGCASNNSLSMFDEMKFAALNAKMASGDPACGKAADIFDAATRGGARAFGLDGGRIEPGALGDALLVRRDAVQMQPCANLASNLVYAADTSCVSAVVCAGKRLWPAAAGDGP